MTSEYRFPVSEIYGSVCQGEGLLIGRPTIFLRLGGCDYRCSWCDSLYAVLPQYRDEWQKLTVDEIVDRVLACYPPNAAYRHVTLSGGNPAIQPAAPLVDRLHLCGIWVAIETQGTLTPEWLAEVDDVTLSPKPPSSGNETAFGPGSGLERIVRNICRTHVARIGGASLCLKVVVFTDEDYQYAKAVHRAFPEVPFFIQTGTAVGHASAGDLIEQTAVLQDRICRDPDMQDVAALPQFHVIAHGHKRGI